MDDLITSKTRGNVRTVIWEEVNAFAGDDDSGQSEPTDHYNQT